jgi:hypothetical protein
MMIMRGEDRLMGAAVMKGIPPAYGCLFSMCNAPGKGLSISPAIRQMLLIPDMLNACIPVLPFIVHFLYTQSFLAS